MSNYIVGLTGGIGSGKSLVGRQFQALGIEVVDADQAARKVVEKGSPALATIQQYFGDAILLADGTLDRSKLRQIIFTDAEQKTWLEQLLHPLIGEWIHAQLNRANSPYAILESPLLLETTQHTYTDRILVVDVPEAIQIERATIRDNNNPEQIKAIMATQLPRQQRLAKADDIIDNSGSVDATGEQVLLLHQKYTKLITDQNNGL